MFFAVRHRYLLDVSSLMLPRRHPVVSSMSTMKPVRNLQVTGLKPLPCSTPFKPWSPPTQNTRRHWLVANGLEGQRALAVKDLQTEFNGSFPRVLHLQHLEEAKGWYVR